MTCRAIHSHPPIMYAYTCLMSSGSVLSTCSDTFNDSHENLVAPYLVAYRALCHISLYSLFTSLMWCCETSSYCSCLAQPGTTLIVTCAIYHAQFIGNHSMSLSLVKVCRYWVARCDFLVQCMICCTVRLCVKAATLLISLHCTKHTRLQGIQHVPHVSIE